MKSLRTLYLLLPLLLASAPAWAQDDKLKRDLLREVEKRLRLEEERLLRDIEKAIDEELGKRSGKPAPAETPKAPARKLRGFLGVRSGDLTDDEKKDLGIKGGIRVIEVVKDGPAAQGGLEADDVITGFDGRSVDSPQEIPALVQGAGPGAKVKVDYLREGKKRTATVTLGIHPADAEGAPAPAPAPKKEQGKAEEDLRERLRKFADKKDERKAVEPKPEEPQAKKPAKPKKAPAPEGGEDDFFAFDEDTFEQFKGLFEQFGVEPEQFFEKGDDGRYRFGGDFKELFKNFNFERFKELLPKMERPEEAPAPAPRRPAEPKKAAPPAGPRPWLGLQPDELSEELRAQLDLPGGLLVAEVLPGSPAEKAGVKKNDILAKIDGKAVTGEESLASFMKTAKIGQEAVLTLVRKSKELTLKVVVGERKE